ncbi:hypothetical protein G5714_004202 [Onychostoma macrolepis]|uniref:Uncharacterized protein n=1 Tax=Onychostoma macrolepis TaxID=369639 RepID=A0A7J6DBM9_9TELE|nr:hypothetical protein G5714_004202 [Onychostoma macrolepis]
MEREDEENQASGYDHPEDQGETEAAAAGQSETGEPTDSFDVSGVPPSARTCFPCRLFNICCCAHRCVQRHQEEELKDGLGSSHRRWSGSSWKHSGPVLKLQRHFYASLQSLPPQTKDFIKFQINKLIYESNTVLLNLEQLEPKE